MKINFRDRGVVNKLSDASSNNIHSSRFYSSTYEVLFKALSQMVQLVLHVLKYVLEHIICKHSPQTTTTASNKQQPLANIIFHSIFFIYLISLKQLYYYLYLFSLTPIWEWVNTKGKLKRGAGGRARC